MRFLIFSLLSMFLLSGCTTRTIYVPKNVYIKYDIPKELVTDDVKLQTPPDREVYIGSNPIERERIMKTLIIGLYGNIASYKLKLKAIKKYDDNVSRIIKEKNKDNNN